MLFRSVSNCLPPLLPRWPLQRIQSPLFLLAPIPPVGVIAEPPRRVSVRFSTLATPLSPPSRSSFPGIQHPGQSGQWILEEGCQIRLGAPGLRPLHPLHGQSPGVQALPGQGFVQLPDPGSHSLGGHGIGDIHRPGQLTPPEGQAQASPCAVGILEIQVNAARGPGVQDLFQGLDLIHPACHPRSCRPTGGLGAVHWRARVDLPQLGCGLPLTCPGAAFLGRGRTPAPGLHATITGAPLGGLAGRSMESMTPGSRLLGPGESCIGCH